MAEPGNRFASDPCRPRPWQVVRRDVLHDHVVRVEEIAEIDLRDPDAPPRVQPLLISAPCCVLVAVLDDGAVLLVEQYRHALGTWTLETPGGMIDPGEDPMAAALRETEEETGVRFDASRCHTLGVLPSSGSHSDEVDHLFVATGGVTVTAPESDVTLVTVAPGQLDELLASGRVPALSAAALLLAARRGII